MKTKNICETAESEGLAKQGRERETERETGRERQGERERQIRRERTELQPVHWLRKLNSWHGHTAVLSRVQRARTTDAEPS